MKKLKMKRLDTKYDKWYQYQDKKSGLTFNIINYYQMWWELRIQNNPDNNQDIRYWYAKSDTQSKLRDVMHKICFFNDWHPSIVETNSTYIEIKK